MRLDCYGGRRTTGRVDRRSKTCGETGTNTSKKKMPARQKYYVILIGMMASGKSTVGAHLARRLGWEFFDTDAVITQEKGKPVSQIFAEEGETEFRCCETQTLARLTNLDRVVIATGGGAPMFEVNQKLLSRGFVVQLAVRVSDVLERTQNDTSRPLLQGDNPLRKIRSLLIGRTPVYDVVSDKKVSVSRRNPSQIVDEILSDKRIQIMIEASKRADRKEHD